MDKAVLWQTVLGEIELSVSRGNFVTWFKGTRLLKIDGDQVVVGTPNVFIKQQLEKKFGDLISQTLKKNGVNPKAIEYKILPASPLRKRDGDKPVVLSTDITTKPARDQPKQSNTLSHSYRLGLNEKYSFKNFIVGSGNELAHAACQAIIESLGTKYNPLFLYGGVGIGKTHLIQAVGNEISRANGDKRVVYVSTEQFVQEFLDAIRYRKNTDFADYYRGADILIVDDIQFIAGKEKTQEEFFHTFNALHQANKQIIITSDTKPKEIPTLTDRLRSRFEWGMAIDMQAPDFETRCAILQLKSDIKEINLPRNVVHYLAETIYNNIRELEGALNQLIAFCDMRGVSPSLDVAQSVLGGKQQPRKSLDPKKVVNETAKYFGVEISELVSPKRDQNIVVPRQIAMYLLRNELNLSFPRIAKELGRKDHTTAIHSVEKINSEQGYDGNIQDAVRDIKHALGESG